MRPSAQRCLPCPGNTLPGPCRISRRQRCRTLGFTSSARATSPIELPRSSRCTAASLNSLVNILLDNPMTQFSFGWILSLNWLCQKWGQVQKDPMKLSGGWGVRPSGMTVLFTAGAPSGGRIKDVKINGREMEPEGMYTIGGCEQEGEVLDRICRLAGVSEARY